MSQPSAADGAPSSIVDEFQDLLIEERVDEASGVVSLRLADPSGAPLPAWKPGAHIDVLVAEGLERQYSLCSVVGESTWRVAVLREPAGRGGSAAIHDAAKQGDLLKVRGPRNHFALVDAPDYLFIAGGIGVTPLMPMLAAVAASGAAWRFSYGGRSRASMACRLRKRRCPTSCANSRRATRPHVRRRRLTRLSCRRGRRWSAQRTGSALLRHG
jgi:ferredoxin-NADP reductase